MSFRLICVYWLCFTIVDKLLIQNFVLFLQLLQINEEKDKEHEANELRPTRDPSRGLGVLKAIAKSGGKKLPVNFDYKGKIYKAIGDNDAAFHNHIGQIVFKIYFCHMLTLEGIFMRT